MTTEEATRDARVDIDRLAKEQQEIRAEIEELGRLTDEQEDILYNICLRQDESMRRQPTNMLLSKITDNPLYKPMLDREYLAYDIYNHGGEKGHEVASLMVTLKGVRYVLQFSDELSARRSIDPAGNFRK
jgi:hypothetical protein